MAAAVEIMPLLLSAGAEKAMNKLHMKKGKVEGEEGNEGEQ